MCWICPMENSLANTVLVDIGLKMSQQWTLVANKDNSILGCIKECCHGMSGEVILLHLALLSSCMEWQVQFLASQYKRHGHAGERPEKGHEGAEDEAELLSVAPSDKTRIKRHKPKPSKYQVPPGHQEMLCNRQDHQTLAQTGQGGCVVFICKGTKRLPVHS